MNSGIYAIKNIINGKQYVGSTIHFDVRWQEHRSTLINEVHSNFHLQRAWKKYGESSFEFKILEEINSPTLKILLDREEWWIDTLNSYIRKYGYNITKKPCGGRLGTKATEKTIRRMSRSMSGKNHPMWGKHLKKETREKISKLQLGVPKPTSGPRTITKFLSPENQIIEINGIRGFCRNNPQYKITHQSMSALAKGKLLTYKGWKRI
jgi:group I intron endonuclease